MDTEKNYTKEMDKLHQKQFESLPEEKKYKGGRTVDELLQNMAEGKTLDDAEMEYRRAVSRTPAPQNRSGQRSRSRQQESSLSAIIQQMRKKKKKEGTKYFDYDLLLVIIFLMCFGLIMLYSTSAYTAQVENGNDMFYFTKQAIIGAVGIMIMLAVSKIDRSEERRVGKECRSRWSPYH